MSTEGNSFPLLHPISYLVEGRKYVIRELDLSDGGVPHGGQTDTEASNTLLG